VAAVDDDHLYHTNTLLYLIPKPNVSPPMSLHTLCAIMNSNPFNRYYRLISLKENRTLPQVEVDMVHNLPVKFDKELLTELEEASRVLHGLRGAQKVHPIQGKDRKDVDEIYALIDDCVELLYLKDEFDHLIN
jgi:hypothetical protein